MKSLSLILPIYNGANKLRGNVQLLMELLPSLTNAFQLIIIDDGSDDGSGDIIAELADQYPQMTAVFHSNRRGEKQAIESGMNLVRHELTFVQATDHIEESKIRKFLVQDGLTHADPGPEVVSNKPNYSAVDPNSEFDASYPGADRQVTQVGLENRLVERLMQWGSALRDYQKQLHPNVESEMLSHEAGNPFTSEATFGISSDNDLTSHEQQPDFGQESAESTSAKIEVVEEGSSRSRDGDSSASQSISKPTIRRSSRPGKPDKLAPPKYTSIPEKRLIQLAHRDLIRHEAHTA